LSFNVRWHENAANDLKGIDKKVARSIIRKVSTYLVSDPMSLGKPLKGMFKGLYRYRFGAYRIMYAVDMGQKEILVLRVGHRKEVYSE